jgi:nucleotide-binding universal stress UspA family protein
MNAQPIRLVCATDLSVRAGRAADAAAAIAARLRGRLTLVHAAQSAGRGTATVPVQGRLLAEAGRLRAGGLEVDPVLLRGFPAGETVLDHVRKEPPALVVVASALKGPLDRWAFGSVAEQIAQASPAPTLVVRAAEPFERWQPKGPALRVFVAVDLYATSDGVLKWVRTLRRAGPCDVTVCHVNEVAPPPGAAAGRELTNPPKLQARLEREVRKKVRDILGDDDTVRVVVRPARFRPGARVVALARAAGAELIVIGTHQRRGLSRLFHASLSRSVLHEAETNVACVPLRAEFDPRDAHLPEYRRVLVATDFSELGNAAVPHACGASAIGGLVRLVHVLPFPETGGAGAARQREEARARLEGLVPAEMGARGQPPEVGVLEHDDPAAALCAEADRFGADLVCLASHGLGGSKAVFGSVTQRVLKMLRRPVLVVRRPDE